MKTTKMPFKDTTLITRTWDYHVWCYFMLRYIRLKLMNSELTPLLLLLLSQLIIHSPSFQKLKYIYFLCTSKSFKHWFTKWTWSILMNKIIAQRFVCLVFFWGLIYTMQLLSSGRSIFSGKQEFEILHLKILMAKSHQENLWVPREAAIFFVEQPCNVQF